MLRCDWAGLEGEQRERLGLNHKEEETGFVLAFVQNGQEAVWIGKRPGPEGNPMQELNAGNSEEENRGKRQEQNGQDRH